jgi:hypothetical protein
MKGKIKKNEKRTDDNQQIKTRVPVLFPEISRKIPFLFLAISKKRQSSQAPPTLFPFLD